MKTQTSKSFIIKNRSRKRYIKEEKRIAYKNKKKDKLNKIIHCEIIKRKT